MSRWYRRPANPAPAAPGMTGYFSRNRCDALVPPGTADPRILIHPSRASRCSLMLAQLDLMQQFTLYFAFAVLALSLAFVWGYIGIFSFGQAAFFGIGGYTYAIIAINLNDSTVAIIGGGSARAIRSVARLLRLLFAPHDHLRRRHHARRNTDPLQVHGTDGERNLPDRSGGSEVTTACPRSRR